MIIKSTIAILALTVMSGCHMQGQCQKGVKAGVHHDATMHKGKQCKKKHCNNNQCEKTKECKCHGKGNKDDKPKGHCKKKHHDKHAY